MKTNKSYIIICALLALSLLLTACGAKPAEAAPSDANSPAESSAAESSEAESAAKPDEDVNIEDWGIRYETVLLTGEDEGVCYSVRYPSLVPAHSTNIAFQMDPTLAMVGYGGPDYRAESVEDVLPACMEHIIDYLGAYRRTTAYGKYGDFAFNIEATESVTINEFPACKYTGTHTFTIDDKSYEVPFAAYSLDLKEKPEAYMYIIVIDESVLHTERPAVEDGVIEDYAYKMALSVKLR